LIRLNANTGDWDTDLLLQDWDADKLADWGVDMPKFETEKEKSPFDDPGITAQDKYAVVVTCVSAIEQEEVFNDLTQKGYNCKILVV